MMFDKQSDFAKDLAQYIESLAQKYICPSPLQIELFILRWCIDNKVRFRNAVVTTGTTTPPEQQS